MKTRTIMDTITDTELTINEMTRKEAIAQVMEWLDSLKFSEELLKINLPYACDPSMYIYIEYNDGSYYSRSYCDEDGKFRRISLVM